MRQHGHLEPRQKNAVLNRLKRIEGQIRGLQRMVEQDRYCPEVLIQISAVHESLRKTAQLMLRSHLSHCVTTAVRDGDPRHAAEIYDELADLFYKYAR